MHCSIRSRTTGSSMPEIPFRRPRLNSTARGRNRASSAKRNRFSASSRRPSIRVFRSPNNVMLAPAPARYTAGPLEIVIDCDDSAVLAIAANALRLFSTPWNKCTRTVFMSLVRETGTTRCTGNYLTCARSVIDRSGTTFTACALSGIAATGETAGVRDEWRISVPPELRFTEAESGDIEDILLLALTIACRASGWEPLHAAAAAKGDRCILLCAPSGGGKSSLTAALVRSGWRALGDDKLLLRSNDGAPELASL